MQSSRRDGREFLLKNLREVEGPLREAIIRHIFERNDHISISMVNISAAYKSSEKYLDRVCASWTSHAIELVDQLHWDIRLALKITNWDRNILEDVLVLIDFLLDCSGVWEDLRTACKKHPDKFLQFRDSPNRTYAELVKNLQDSIDKAINTRTQLVTHLKSENSNAKDYIDDLIGNLVVSEIPTATLRELFIFNEAYGKRDEIWRHVDRMLQSLEEEKRSTGKGENTAGGDWKDAFQRLTDIVVQIFAFYDPTQAGKSKELQNVAKKAWLARCLVLVLDTENRVIVTGGTKPTCHDSGLFGKALNTITHLRVGEQFAEVINNCSKEFTDWANKAKQSTGLENKEQLSYLTASRSKICTTGSCMRIGLTGMTGS